MLDHSIIRNFLPSGRRQATHLVENGQLEFLLGGWCMNDEAASHYTAMLEQNGLGLQWLQGRL